MLDTAWTRDFTRERLGYWRFEIQLPSQRFLLVAFCEKLVSDLDGFLTEHLRNLDRLDAEDIELLVAKVKDFFGGLAMVGVVVIEHNTITYGVEGGSVYFMRAGKGGFMADGQSARFFEGSLLVGDVMAIGVGKQIKEIFRAKFEKNAYLPDADGLGLVVRCSGDREQALEKIEPSSNTPVAQPSQTAAKSSTLTKWAASLGNVSRNIWEKIPHKKEPQVYVKSTERKRLGLAALAVLAVLVLSVGLGFRKRQANLKKEQFNTVYQPAVQLLNDAEMMEKNEPLFAREKLIVARASVVEAMAAYDEKSDEHMNLSSLKKLIDESYARVSGEEIITNPSDYYDLSVVREGVLGGRMSFGDGWVVVLDKTTGVLIGVEVNNKQGKILAGGEILKEASLAAASTGKAVVLAKAGLVGAYFGDRATETLIARDEIWKDPGAIGMFGGNVYLADKSTGEIWQYPGFDGGLGARKRWFGPGVLPDLSLVTSMSVDGDIWLGMKNGTVAHYRRGAPMRVVFEGLADPLGEVTALAVEYEKDDLFVLDKTNSRVVWFTKDGGYKKQFMWEGMKDVSDMVVLESDQTGRIILLLSGQMIYQIPVK